MGGQHLWQKNEQSHPVIGYIKIKSNTSRNNETRELLKIGQVYIVVGESKSDWRVHTSTPGMNGELPRRCAIEFPKKSRRIKYEWLAYKKNGAADTLPQHK